MPITNQKDWNKWVKNNQDAYGGACIRVAKEAFDILDQEPGEFDPNDLISRADDKAKTGGITGFMAGCVAGMITQCHSRGKEFQQLWNKSYGSDSKEGVVNPAIITIGVKGKGGK